MSNLLLNLKNKIRKIKQFSFHGCIQTKQPPVHFEKHVNINSEKRLLFIHNPKCAGTSLRKALGLDITATDHRPAHFYVSKYQWEALFKICVVREPLSRLLSSYRFHCLSDYSGGYLSQIPNLKGMSLKHYFQVILSGKIVGMGAQHLFLQHPESSSEIDCLLFFEDLDYGKIPSQYLSSNVTICNSLEQRNGDRRELEVSRSLICQIVDYLKEDYLFFKDRYQEPDCKILRNLGLIQK